jgi:membrane associated rhomboid family serine protease
MGLYDRQYYRDDSRMDFGFGHSARTAVTTLIIINVAIFVIDAFSGRGGGALMEFLSLDSGLFRQPWKIWQLLSHGFAHSPINDLKGPGIWHLFFNMLGLFMFGVPVEQKYGKYEFLRFYIAAIIFSGFVWLLSTAFRAEPAALLGASGAVSAVVLLMALNFPFREVLFFGVVPMQIWMLATIYLGLDIVGTLSGSTKVAYVAHLAGATFAALYFWLGWNFSGLSKLRNWMPRRRPKLRVHQPSADERLQEEADRVLEKIHQTGEASLTRRERRTLERYSEQMRQRRKPNS